jgi:hypothetical protein
MPLDERGRWPNAGINHVFTLSGPFSGIEIESTGCGSSLFRRAPPVLVADERTLAHPNTAAAAIPRAPARSRKIFWHLADIDGQEEHVRY